MNRAYSLFSIKSFDDAKREIEGLASSPSPDRMQDVVEPRGGIIKLPTPFLLQHDHSKPIGQVTHATVKNDGIHIKAKLARTDEPGTLKNRLDEAWQSIKLGLIRGLSIGFNALERSPLTTGGYHFTKWELMEVSAVTIPANAEASIQTVKRFATEEIWQPLQMPQVNKAQLERLCKADISRFQGSNHLPQLMAAFFTFKNLQMQGNQFQLDKFAEIDRRLADIEARGTDPKNLSYRGVWKSQETYEPGDFTTHGGGLWHCNARSRDQKPGRDSTWTLAVKRGAA